MSEITIDELLRQGTRSKRLFDALAREIEQIGESTLRVSKSQIAFRRKKNFAIVWIPSQHLGPRETAPLVLMLSFPRRDRSSRWKEITQVGPERFTHHLELYRTEEIDGEVRRWLKAAWDEAG